MGDLVWLDGALIDADDAHVSVFDHGVTVGDGVFETLKAVDGRPFAVRRHLARLRASADAIGLRIPYEDDVLRAAMAEVAAAQADLPLARVRLTMTGGAAPLGSERGEASATVMVAAAPLAARPPTTAVCVVPWPRNERGALAGVKSTSYAENVVALAHAKERGCSEAIFATTTDLLSEGTGSNVFVALGGRLLTPPLTAGCLAGVTRALVLEWTDAVEEDIPMEVFAEADEVFLTSTGRDVQPVHQVIALDGTARDLPAPGPLTQAAMEAWAANTAVEDDP